MLGAIARKIFGTANERFINSLRPIVNSVNAFEQYMIKLNDDELKAKTAEFKTRISNGETLDSILPEAFAVVREASRRVMGMRHFDVQLIGGIVLHRGMISEMRTGEGKTLVATLAAYLNALTGDGVHVVTVNDYLAKRDSEWMGRIYRFLGLTVGTIYNDIESADRRMAYASDITYGTNNEYGFDYLRDNLKFSLESMVQRKFNYAIIDEVDSILIDEARTPLIVSGPAEDSSELYITTNAIIPLLTAEDFDKDEKSRTVTLTDTGVKKVEDILLSEGRIKNGESVYDIQNVALVHHINQALKAHHLFTRDVDYIIKGNKAIIIDEFTGRMMEGRRYSEGLHQAIEAKENVPVQSENQTLASITFQNYFRLYTKLSGMTGTAMTEAAEFSDIYRLQVIDIPTNIPVSRIDNDDVIYRSAKEKYKAILEQIDECHARKQPILVGTSSIEKSELLSDLLKKKKIAHQVLNARYHEKEASIIAQAGRPGAVTIATNMAGRGTDIMLGGNADMLIKQENLDEDNNPADKAKADKIRAQVADDRETVKQAGGLFVLGTERHESRRIDNQLRGRSGRQGDAGESKFYLSFEDDLLRIFGGSTMDALLQKAGMEEGEAVSHSWMNKVLERAQGKVESRNFEMRKSLLKFDDVMNDQRKIIYEQRRDIMQSEDVSETTHAMRMEVEEDLVHRFIPEKSFAEGWDIDSLSSEIYRIFGLHLPIQEWAKEEGVADKEILDRIQEHTSKLMQDREQEFTPKAMRVLEKRVLLETLDHLWKEHLYSLDNLRQGINLRAYGQRDPLNEYKLEAFNLFEGMLFSLRDAVTEQLSHIRINTGMDDEDLEDLGMIKAPSHMKESRFDPAFAAEFSRQMHEENAARPHTEAAERVPGDPSTWGRVGRNEACPCGSGKKYKHCHGML